MNQPASRISPELRFFLFGSAGLSAIALLSFCLSFAVEYVSFLGRPDSIAFWTPLVVVGLGLASLAMWVHRVHGVRLKQAGGVLLLGPIFAYGMGRVGELGAALYLAAMAVAYWKALPYFEAAEAASPEVQQVIRALAEQEAKRANS
ncbi:MAG: hypothetical protein Q8N26_37085 [Myxococcales bacterium]|nr:hypothetical protein [Myxococcales bacterium]